MVVDVDVDDTGSERSLCTRVELNLTKSLAMGRYINARGDKLWILIKYENFPRLCFMCGKIIDTVECTGPIANNSVQQFGL